MTNTIQKYWQTFRDSIRGVDSNRQLALGVMFGMIIGLIPKDSLFCYAFLILMMLTTANLICAIIAGFMSTWISAAIIPISHRIGSWILTFDPLESVWAQLYELPLMGWTRFENTVVTGSLVIALLIAIPVYQLSFRFFEVFGDALFRRLKLGRLPSYDAEKERLSIHSDQSNPVPEFAGTEI